MARVIKGYHFDWLVSDDLVGEMAKPLPPGVPLDEDIFDVLLQHLKWDRDSRFSVEQNVKSGMYTKLKYEEAVQLQTKCANAVEQIQMEALWRQIKRKKERACSAI